MLALLMAKALKMSNSYSTDSIQKILEENKRLLEAQQIAGIGNWEVDLNTQQIEWSKTVYDILDLENKSIKPTIDYFLSFVHEKDIKEFEQSAEAALKSGEFQLTHRIITQKGTIKYVHELASAIYNENKEMVKFRGTIQDITNLKKAEIALANEKKKTDLIIRGTGLGTYQWNIQTGETIINDRYAEMLGYDMNEINPNETDFWENVLHPDDKIIADQKLANHIFNKEKSYEIELRLKHKNGHWIWVHDSGKVGSWTDDG